MAKRITQQTFDDVVQENIHDFDMTVDAAIEDAIQQFQSQGVELDNIIKDPAVFELKGSGDGKSPSEATVIKHPVLNALQQLNLHLESNSSDNASVLLYLEILQKECNIDLAHRCLAGNNQAYSLLIKLLAKHLQDASMIKPLLQAFSALLNGQPDLLDESGSAIFIQLLVDFMENVEIIELVVRLIRFCCIKHEGNRQNFVGKNLIVLLSRVLLDHQTVPLLVKEICFVLRVLTFDDDIRVPFGKAHEHAKMIVTEGDALKAILKICEVYADNQNVLGELFLTLGSLVVRNEFCQEVLNLGGVHFILQAFGKNINDKTTVRQALVVLRALAGSDEVKVAVVQEFGVELAVAALTKHGSIPSVAEGGCAVLAALTLRNPDHCHRVMECRGYEAIIQVMKIHPKDAGVQKQACMALRNLVARTREHCASILECGAEDLLNYAGSYHKDCVDESKAALRDLGCAVHLKELWTGQKGSLEQ